MLLPNEPTSLTLFIFIHFFDRLSLCSKFMALFSFILHIYIYIVINSYIFIFIYIYLHKYINTTCPISITLCYLCVYHLRADHLVLENLLGLFSAEDLFSRSLQSPVARSSLSRVEAPWAFFPPMSACPLVSLLFRSCLGSCDDETSWV